ncbi:MAG TPA: hypothetical protein VK638_09530, partial [Edaphobacter sp.]|nr:hypothetical protein [Edaphobacter sp.]
RILRESEERGFSVGPARPARRRKSLLSPTDSSLHRAVSVQSASPNECQLVEEYDIERSHPIDAGAENTGRLQAALLQGALEGRAALRLNA